MATPTAAHGHPRYTKDLDVWVRADQENAAKILVALAVFGFGDVGLRVDDTVVQLGREPQRIDLLTFISGVDFDRAWECHVECEMGTVTVPVIGRADLRRNKLATGRLRDLADAEDLPHADFEAD